MPCVLRLTSFVLNAMHLIPFLCSVLVSGFALSDICIIILICMQHRYFIVPSHACILYSQIPMPTGALTISFAL